MEFHGTKQADGIMYPAIQDELFRRYVASMKDGTLVRVAITKSEAQKTYQQIKAIWGLAIAQILDAFEDRGWDASIIYGDNIPTGTKVSKGTLLEFLYQRCPIEDDEGNRIRLSNKQCSIERATKFFDDIRNFAASQWSITVPDPDPNWKSKEAKNGKDT